RSCPAKQSATATSRTSAKWNQRRVPVGRATSNRWKHVTRGAAVTTEAERCTEARTGSRSRSSTSVSTAPSGVSFAYGTAWPREGTTPDEDVRRRYRRSLANLPEAFGIADKA